MSQQLAALRERLTEVPVVKSGLSLMTGTVLTSGLGLIFWILAAHLYDEADFGVSTTVVYTMMMLADAACLGLRTGLVRFIPTSGSATAKVIVWGYMLALAAAVATAMVFLIGLGVWAPGLSELRSSAVIFLFFILSTGFWALFMLEDAVLVGLRKAPWVPIENSLFGILKIVLLFPFASLSPSLGIFWAWTLPVFPIVFGVNALVRREIMGGSATAALTSVRSSTQSLVRSIVTFSAAEWFSTVARLVALAVIPLLVLSREGDVGAGYFNASWLIAFTIFNLSINAGYALLAESSYEQARLNVNSVQAAALSLGLTLPIAVIGLVGAPLILRIFGANYADNSSSLLRILMIATIPNVIHQIHIGRLRSQEKMIRVVVLETLLSVLVVVLAWQLLPQYGIEGVGYAWLIGLGILALYATVAESVWWWAARLDTRLVRGIGRVLGRSTAARPARGMETRLRSFMTAQGLGANSYGVATWLQPNDRGQSVVLPTDGHNETVVEFARSQIGVDTIARRRATLASLVQDPRLIQMHPLLPSVRGYDLTPGQEYLALDRPRGETAAALVERQGNVEQVCHRIFEAVRPLRDATATVTAVAPADVDAWLLESTTHLELTGRASKDQLGRLRRQLIDGLCTVPVAVGQVHGELALDNVTVTDEPVEVVGLGSWERTQTAPLVVDPACLALSDLMRRGGGELGGLVTSLLESPAPFENHPAMVLAAAERFGPERAADLVPLRTALILGWLFLVGRPLPPGRTVSSDEVWLARNAKPVLTSLCTNIGAPR